MKKLIFAIVLSLSLNVAFAATPAAKQPPAAASKATLYHGYQNQQYVSDSSDSTTAYVTTASAEKFRPLRVQIFVPGLFIGRFGATIDYKINNAFAIGGLYRTWTLTGTSETCNWNAPCQSTSYSDYYNVYGLNMEYAVNGNLNMDGWILNPRILQAHYKFHDGFNDTNNQKENQAQTSSDIGIYLMHQWAWPTGIYMQLGVGADYMSNPNTNVLTLTKSNFGGDWDFTLGYQF